MTRASAQMFWHTADGGIIAFLSVLKRPPCPDSTIEPVVTKETTDAQRHQPLKLEPTAYNGSDKTDNSPHKKRSGEINFSTRHATGVVRYFRTSTINRHST